MSSDEGITIPPASASLEEKDNPKTDMAEQHDVADIAKPEYSQGWKLWLVYVATLLNMFLVGFNSILSS
jgi:hypothetical protein